MTVRPDESQVERLRRRAETEGRSMQAIVLAAIDEYIDRRDGVDVMRIARDGAVKYRDALEELGR